MISKQIFCKVSILLLPSKVFSQNHRSTMAQEVEKRLTEAIDEETLFFIAKIGSVFDGRERRRVVLDYVGSKSIKLRAADATHTSPSSPPSSSSAQV